MLTVTKISTYTSNEGKMDATMSVSLTKAAEWLLGLDKISSMATDEAEDVRRKARKEIARTFPQVYEMLRAEGVYVSETPKASFSYRQNCSCGCSPGWKIAGMQRGRLRVSVSIDVTDENRPTVMVRSNDQRFLQVSTLRQADTAALIDLGPGADGSYWMPLEWAWAGLVSVAYSSRQMGDGSLNTTEVRIEPASGMAFERKFEYGELFFRPVELTWRAAS